MSYIGTGVSKNPPNYKLVSEFTATAGQTLFAPSAYSAGYIDVFRNGVKLGSSDFTATNGTTVTLANACAAGDFVRFESVYINPTANAIPATTGAVSTSLIADNAITTAKIAAGAVVQADLATGVAGTGPAFSAYQSTLQSTGSGAFTKIQFQTEEFDTNNNFDNVTNYRFTPTVAGYYQVNSGIALAASATGLVLNSIYKNGSEYKRGNVIANNAAGVLAVASALIYMNGSTDYLEIYSYQSSGIALNTVAQQVQTYFNGSLVRAA